MGVHTCKLCNMYRPTYAIFLSGRSYFRVDDTKEVVFTLAETETRLTESFFQHLGEHETLTVAWHDLVTITDRSAKFSFLNYTVYGSGHTTNCTSLLCKDHVQVIRLRSSLPTVGSAGLYSIKKNCS